jgi:hypothetical protein
MSGYEGRCPSCGAPVVFALGSSLLKVCDHCGSAVARAGADLANYGKVAGLIPTPSLLALGVRGGYEGAPAFELVGRLQLDHGAGTWDEWLMAFPGESWAWLSEAQGRYHYMAAAALPPVPSFSALQPDDVVDLGPPGVFRVSEVRSARFAAAAGELPFAAPIGAELHFADLVGPNGGFATIDYGQGEEAEALYVGREVQFDELGFRGLPDREERRAKARGQSLSCPQCGGPLELRAGGETQRIACPWCGSLLDPGKDLQVLSKLQKPPFQPHVPLGTKGTFEGHEWTVIGAMIRSVTVDGTRYPWQELLLYGEGRGFRWLVESKGHWVYVTPLTGGDVHADRGAASAGGIATYKGDSFKHFQGGTASVDHVLGEFYWAVAQGHEVQADDWVAPPRMLSREKDGKEVTWSLGEHLEVDQVRAAFGMPELPLPMPQGVGPVQPWKHAKDAPTVFTTFMLAAAALLVLALLFSFRSSTVLTEQVALKAKPAAGQVAEDPDAAVFVGPFDVTGRGNLKVEISSAVSNAWVFFDAALIDEDTGDVQQFGIENAYYHGSDSDGAWTEGSQSGAAHLGSVPPGRYTLRLAPSWDGPRPPVSTASVRVVRATPRLYQFVLAFLALLIRPALLFLSRAGHETLRWSESDHASTGDDEDDE